METPFAGQDPIVKFWAILGSAILAILAVLAGAALLLAAKLTAEWDVELPRMFIFFSRLGLGAIVAVWITWMIAVIALIGYRRSEIRDFIALLMFGVCAFYLLATLLCSLFPFMSYNHSLT